MSSTLIRNGRLIDGTGGSPRPNAAILVEDDRITQVGETDTLVPSGEETRILDAGGGTILPGFIDCHVHLVLENLTIERVLSTPLSFTLLQSIDHMRRTLEAGVTSVRDAGGADQGLKMAVEEGLVAGPRMQVSVTILSITGGHLDYFMPSGNEYSLFPAYPGRPVGICDGVEEVRKKVRELLRAGAEVIKVCTTGGTMSPRDHPTFTQFSPAELEVMVQEAAFHGGKKVMAHAQGTEGIKNAVRAGVHSVEHGVYLDDEAIELMLEHETFLVPTLSAPAFVLERHASSDEYPEWGVRKVREVFDANLDSIARAYQAGVRIAMGTDACVRWRRLSLPREQRRSVWAGKTGWGRSNPGSWPTSWSPGKTR
jgi:imidazolonepropionase-like amidohydrolase